MPVGLTQLNYVDEELVLDRKVYHLRKFDLLARAWVHDEFKTDTQPDGLHALAQRLAENWYDVPAVTKTVFHLLKEKDTFGTYENFLNTIEKSEKQTELIILEMYKALNEVLKKSEPSDEQIGETQELKKSGAATR